MLHLCEQFVLRLEEYLDLHPGTLGATAPAWVEAHATACKRCRHAWSDATTSRRLLPGLHEETAVDPYFWTRLQATIQQQQAGAGARAWGSLGVSTRGFALACVLFVATLGSFVYNLHRTESPNADEAMVLDVPHLNQFHPSDDHVRPQFADAMLNLMTP